MSAASRSLERRKVTMYIARVPGYCQSMINPFYPNGSSTILDQKCVSNSIIAGMIPLKMCPVLRAYSATTELRWNA